MITQDTFKGLAFPVIRVRYTGNGYAASLRRDSTLTVRASVGYNHALSASENALEAARQCWTKYTSIQPTDDTARLFIPGDLDAERYSFTVVPDYFFTK